MRIFINTYFPKLIFLGLSLILFLPLVVSPETVFPFVVGKSLWFRGVIYSISCLWLILITVNNKYLPEKSTLILLFSLFVLSQALAGLFGSSPQNSFWGNWERMEGVVEYFHWLIFILIAFSVLKTKLSWINLWKVNTFVGLIVATLGFFESLDLVIPLVGGLDIFPLVVNPEGSYTGGERAESTIGNPAYLATYLSMVTFSSIALIYREFKINYRLSIFNTYASLKKSSKTYVVIAGIASLISIWTILSSGSRGSLIGIAASILLISIMLSIVYKKISKFTLAPAILIIILIPTFFFITTTIESQREDLRVEVLSKYFPIEVFEESPNWKGLNADKERPEIASTVPGLSFVQEYNEIEKSSGKLGLSMEQLLEHMVETGKISEPEMKSRICSDQLLTYFWLTERDSFRECTSTMKFISLFGSGISYPFRSGFDIGERGFAWSAAWKGFLDNPIFGIGPENFPVLHYKYINLNNENMADDKPHFDRAHNRVLHIMATSGIIGFIALISFWIYIGILITKRALRRDSENIFWMLLGCFFISYVTFSMFNFAVSSIFLQIMLLIAFLTRTEQGFGKKDELAINVTKETKEQAFAKDSMVIVAAIIIPIVTILVIRSYVAIPFQAAKVTPPLGSPTSLIEAQENINKFEPLSNYGRQELMYIVRRDMEKMLGMASEADKFAEAYTALVGLVSEEYRKGIEVEPDHFNIHFGAASVYTSLAVYDANNLDVAINILNKLEELSPNSIQTLELKIRIALLMNDPINAEPLIQTWKKVIPAKWRNFWDESLGIIKGEIVPEWDIICRNEEYPSDKPKFEDSNVLYNNELDNGVIVGVKQEPNEGSLTISPGNIVKLDYTGWLSNGCIFDSSYFEDVNTLTFKVGMGLAVEGFESGVLGLGEGSIARIVIPPEMAYGSVGVKNLIPPNSTIYFEVKILEVRAE